MDLPEDWFEQIKKAYPKRDGGNGWPIANAKARGALDAGARFDRMMLGIRNYAKYCQRKGWIGTDLVQQAKTFFGPGQWWEEYADMDMRTPAEIALDTQWAHLEARAKALGFKEVDRSRGLATVEYAIKAEEDKRRLRVVS